MHEVSFIVDVTRHMEALLIAVVQRYMCCIRGSAPGRLQQSTGRAVVRSTPSLQIQRHWGAVVGSLSARPSALLSQGLFVSQHLP